MATYQQSGGGSGSGSTIGRGASRALSSALRSAARSTDSGESMDLDGGLGRAGRGGHRRTGARSAGPLDQV
ncbi:uncharacterized protein EHS24_008634 [Apiotrichum porosum]|uniref:Uncharacterized protein n=1 Tax=Apiotrichum porosum TaxID=105984 RepID=A0A427XQV4_9TREE|nr:uncharacterized protein EHS24_008634 [Apiotrichum porosum]RSH81197.1 hypothetical protein EHS24_008634 [Apiotrichum porosum]